MVSDQALLEEGLVRAMLHSGHSRVPVYRCVTGRGLGFSFQQRVRVQAGDLQRQLPSSCSRILCMCDAHPATC